MIIKDKYSPPFYSLFLPFNLEPGTLEPGTRVLNMATNNKNKIEKSNSKILPEAGRPAKKRSRAGKTGS